jgi:hypothetical protein
MWPPFVNEIDSPPRKRRQVQRESLRWLVDLARPAGVQRIVVNGSNVTDKLEPNDVDCVLLIGPEFPVRQGAAKAAPRRPAAWVPPPRGGDASVIAQPRASRSP